MNRKEAAELLPIIKAFGEGKDIEMRSKNPHAQLNGWEKMDEFIFGNFEYRIKPEPKYRPFRDAKECLQEMQKHQPIGWIKSKEATKDIYFTITGLTNVIHGVILDSTGGWSFSGLFDYYTFADGTPFGVKVEEQL